VLTIFLVLSIYLFLYHRAFIFYLYHSLLIIVAGPLFSLLNLD
jgi:hypothetical protein